MGNRTICSSAPQRQRGKQNDCPLVGYKICSELQRCHCLHWPPCVHLVLREVLGLKYKLTWNLFLLPRMNEVKSTVLSTVFIIKGKFALYLSLYNSYWSNSDLHLEAQPIRQRIGLLEWDSAGYQGTYVQKEQGQSFSSLYRLLYSFS